MKRTESIFFLLFFALAATAQEQLSLQKCRELALQSGHEILVAEKNILKAGNEKAAMRTLFLPSVSASATGIYLKDNFETEIYLPTATPNPATGELQPNIMVDPLGQPVIGPDGNPVFNLYAWLPLELSLQGAYLAGVQAEQPVFAGGKIITANKMATIGSEIARQNLLMQQANIIASADQAYWLYISVSEKLKLAENAATMLKELVKKASDAYETGMASENDYLKAKVEYNKALLNVQKASSGLELARMSLCRITGMPYSTQLFLTDTLAEMTIALPAGTEDENIANRPEYKLLESTVALEDQKVNLARADFLPQAGIRAGYSYLGGVEFAGSDYSNTNLSVMASVKIPLFHWGEGMKKVSSAKVSKDIKQLELENAARLMQLETEQARFNLNHAALQIEIAENALGQATENLRISNDNYELGAETITDLLIAQTSWQQAYSELIEAKANYKTQETLYLKAAGKLVVKPEE
ncbi:MAG: TolC family protein [Bacteroidales bacterium]|nr:TolC family protein [Bacteroidales bacterium]